LIDSHLYNHYSLLENLYDICKQDLDEWLETYNIEEEAVNAGKVYGADKADPKCGWWGCPVIHGYKTTKWAKQFPRTYEATKELPGVVHVAINFTKPGCTIPVHKDKEDYINEEQIILIPTIIGIKIPSKDIKEVGMEIHGETVYVGEKDIVSFNPNHRHGSWNNTNKWRITLYITTERSYWNYDQEL